ncbi:GTPase-activator protein [Trichostrongylus colubriformis]|uniref:GTPase-activator protein n=1 Tax=Trichostrongylus colubriformis TaxID=6319 RepID=A0AAN8J2Z4_TRICO
MKMLPSNEITTSSCTDGPDDDPSMLQSTSSSSSRLPSQIISPSESAGRPWYHGEISQTEAEVLLDVAQPGRFLVRKAGPTRYFLSCVTDNHLLLHLPIQQLGRFFYLNAGKFTTLAEAVQHHCEMVDTAEPVQAQTPALNSSSISPSRTVPLRRYLALSKCDDLADNDELSISRGDVITQLRVLEGTFILAKNENTGQTGYLSVKTVAPILSESLSVQELPYFHSVLTKDALKMLTCVGAGAFLVRISSQGADAFALLVNTRNKIEKFLIRGAAEGTDGFLLAGRHFPSLQHIIDRYCVHPIASDVRLTHAVLPPPQSSSRRASAEKDAAAQDAMTTSDWSQNVTSIEATDDYVNHNCASHTVAAVQAWRKSREEKAWKSCWLTLCDDCNGGCELIVADTEASVKARLILDLAYCVMYLLDDSVFAREGCVFLSQTDIDLSGVYICFRPTQVLIKWLELLRPRVLGLRTGAIPVMIGLQFEAPRQSFVAVLQLHIDKYRCETVKPDGYYSAYGMLCGVKVCTTPVITASLSKGSLSSVIFDCSFLLPLVPPENGTLQFSILSHSGGGKKNRPLGVSALFPLPDSRQIADSPDIGFTFRAIRHRIPVLSHAQYAPLLEYLKKGTVELFEWASDALSIQQRSLLCWCIVSLLLPDRDELLHFISQLLRRVLATCSAENVMRQDSLTTTLLTQTLRIGGRSRLEEALDAAGMSNVKLLQPTDVDNVVEMLDKLVSANSLVNDLLVTVARVAAERFPDEPHLLRRVLSNVYILRFVNPLLISYMSGNLMNQQLAKGVQAAANVAAAASPRLEDVTIGSQCLRALFERLGVAAAAESESGVFPPSVQLRPMAFRRVLSRIFAGCGLEGICDTLLWVVGAEA